MVFEGNVSLSIFVFDPDNFNPSGFAHELHHLGFEHWIKRNPKLSRLFLEENSMHEKIAVKLFISILSEGLANYFCNPKQLYTTSQNTPQSARHNEKIKHYEKSLKRMVYEVQSLLSDCLSKTASIENCEELLKKILFDPEHILPQVHFIGGRLIEMLDKDPRINRSEHY